MSERHRPQRSGRFSPRSTVARTSVLEQHPSATSGPPPSPTSSRRTTDDGQPQSSHRPDNSSAQTWTRLAWPRPAPDPGNRTCYWRFNGGTRIANRRLARGSTQAPAKTGGRPGGPRRSERAETIVKTVGRRRRGHRRPGIEALSRWASAAAAGLLLILTSCAAAPSEQLVEIPTDRRTAVPVRLGSGPVHCPGDTVLRPETNPKSGAGVVPDDFGGHTVMLCHVNASDRRSARGVDQFTVRQWTAPFTPQLRAALPRPPRGSASTAVWCRPCLDDGGVRRRSAPTRRSCGPADRQSLRTHPTRSGGPPPQ